MTAKPEVNLEVAGGFFRITAPDATYNITVLGGAPGIPASDHVRKAPAPVAAPECRPCPSGAPDEEFYRQISTELYHDVGQLAKSLSATIKDIPLEDRRLKRAELDEAGEKIEDAKSQLKDIVEMTENATMEIMDCVEDIQGQTSSVRELLSSLREHKAFQPPEDAADSVPDEEGDPAAEFAAVEEALARAEEIVRGLEPGAGSAATPEEVPGAAPRYAFPLDTVFQTLYEFCTNETVKGHIATSREQAAELFDYEVFLDLLNERAAAIEPDADNFIQVPLPDLFHALRGSCGDEKIKNLFKRMAASQDSIFLDKSLPLEVPPAAEAAVPSPAPGEADGDGSPLEELGRLLGDIRGGVGRLAAAGGGRPGVPAPGMSTMSMADQTEIFTRIENAFSIASNISTDVQKITEALSFQDLSGQQILKIIKLLSDFQVQLLAIVVSFGTQLKQKEKNAAITADESKRLAQDEVDTYINRIGKEEGGEPGVLDQEAVNRMLEDLGF